MLLNTLRHGTRRILTRVINIEVQQTAGIKGKAGRDPSYQRPKPFPYLQKRYGVLQGFYDKTSWRFDENSKIVVVEGPVASGKTEFAKALADELDMLYLRAVTMDDLFINSYGFDYRQLNPRLPESVQFFDVKQFLENPLRENVALFQINMLILKYSQYIDAVAHVMNTGQGVVLERSCFSDQVFCEAMYKSGYISKGARSVYNHLRQQSIPQILKPPLVIYLDVPVPKVIENIKKRNISYEVNSKALTPEYLTNIEKYYKEIHLPDISTHAELLVYDWSNGGDVEVVVEDIERIDFDRFEKHDKKLEDWRFYKEWDLCEKRIWYTSLKNRFLMYFMVPRIDVPELLANGDDGKILDDILSEAPGEKFAVGFNADMGDKNLLFKLSGPKTVSPWFR